MIFFVWAVCIILVYLIAEYKNRSKILWFVFSLFAAPLVLITILLMPKLTKEGLNTSNCTLKNIREDLEDIKSEFNYLSERLHKLESKINGLLPLENIAEPSIGVIPQDIPKIEKTTGSSEKTDIEINIGKFWLNKIGILVFTLGIGFLISYTFKYFGALAKIMFGYLVSVFLFFFGAKLEKRERFINYGRVLLGGAWAITYFTTYAMYHFDASKIIQSQLLDLILLGCVAIGIIIHSLKYKYEELFAIALLISYITATLGDISYFTFLSCGMLGITTLVLVYKMQWIRVIFLGVVLSYLTHLFWVIRHIYSSRVIVGTLNVNEVYFLINIGFLFIYWCVFTIGVHLIKSIKEEGAVFNKLSAANFCNMLLFFFMVYPKLYHMYPDYKFTFIYSLGIIYLIISFIMDKVKNNHLFVSNIIISVSLLTIAVPIRFMPYNASLIWLIEIPFLLLTGLIFYRKVLRYLSFLLALVLFFKLLSVDFSTGSKVLIFGHNISWEKVISLVGSISMAFCFFLARYSKQKQLLSNLELALCNIFSALSTFYLTLFIWLIINPKWLTLSLSIELSILFTLGFLLSDKYLRIYSFVLILILAVRFCFIDNYHSIPETLKWTIILIELLSLYSVYFLYKKVGFKSSLFGFEENNRTVVFVIATFLLVFTIYMYILRPWTTLSLGLAGAVLFLTGFLSKDRTFRFGGFVIFAITMFRVIFVDLSMLHIIYKIVSFIVLGILFLGISFIYTKYNVAKLK